MRRAPCFTALLLGHALLSGCAENAPPQEAVFVGHRAPIRNGEFASEPSFGAVAALVVVMGDTRMPYCSGTFIEPDLVATAAHCAVSSDAFPFDTYLEQGHIRVLTGEDVVTAPDQSFKIAEVRVPTQFRTSQQGNDIALLRLDRASDVAPVPFANAADALDIGDAVTFVGYGKDEHDSDGVRLKTSGVVSAVCPKDNPGSCRIKLASGDEAFMPPATLLFETEKKGPCTGDSGGAVLFDVLGHKTLAGIVSFGDGNCSRYAVSTHAADFVDWAESAFEPEEVEGCSTSLRRTGESWRLPFVLLAGGACLRLKRLRR